MADEEIDVVDAQDEVIGRVKRSGAHVLGLRHRGVHIFLFAADGKLLLQKRAKGTCASPGMLDCSVSEHVRAHESYYQAAQRGLMEELGLEPIDLTCVVKFSMEYGENDYMISQLFEGIVNPSYVHINAEEVESVDYKTLSNLLQLVKEDSTQFSRWFRELLLWYCNERSDIEVLQYSGRAHWPGTSKQRSY